MDNLFSSFCAVEALSEAPINGDGNINCIALFNHEEVGSVSSTGAESSLIPSLIHRLSPTASGHAQSVAKSFLISADMGHALHPSYQSKHEENHKPAMNGGVVLKVNAKQRYTTDAVGSFLVKKLIERRGGKVQTYEVRNDMYVPYALCSLKIFISNRSRLFAGPADRLSDVSSRYLLSS